MMIFHLDYYKMILGRKDIGLCYIIKQYLNSKFVHNSKIGLNVTNYILLISLMLEQTPLVRNLVQARRGGGGLQFKSVIIRVNENMDLGYFLLAKRGSTRIHV